MRWGVRDEMTNEHMTTDLCMTELRNCQRLSMGPNFIFFGGQKYGYRPIPTEIITSELMQLREVLVSEKYLKRASYIITFQLFNHSKLKGAFVKILCRSVSF
jgi:hypothetical protein